MPIYEYACSCGHKFEEIHSFSHPTTIKCPKCGKKKAQRLISLAAFHLKGSGWYSKDVAKESTARSVKKEEKSSEPKSTESTTTSESASETKKPEAAPKKEKKKAKAESKS